jgi:hypothetical protein
MEAVSSPAPESAAAEKGDRVVLKIVEGQTMPPDVGNPVVVYLAGKVNGSKHLIAKEVQEARFVCSGGGNHFPHLAGMDVVLWLLRGV